MRQENDPNKKARKTSTTKLRNFNPDVLNCLANLSNDEVFTPPSVVDKMLELLPQEIFADPNATFLDPVCKSGVFLRQIAKRLLAGLKDKIPDQRERLEHILKKQLYGIAITELTSLLARRTLYCSKYANSPYSVVKFPNVDGNIRFKRIEHQWEKGKCKFCGASQNAFGVSTEEPKENHAYEWIHREKVEDIFGMKFDVIIGNPPYQTATSGSVESQAVPIYQKFIEQAKKLNPRYLSMIVPSRWMNGGFGLDDFRNEMLNDAHIRVLHDYLNASDCFTGIALTGGVCFFLRDSATQGKCKVYTHTENGQVSYSERFLLEPGLNTFVRFNEALSILRKATSTEFLSFSDIVSQRDPFGLNYYEDGKEKMFKLFSKEKKPGDQIIYSFGWQKDGISYANEKYVQTRKDAVNKYKVFISKANGAASVKAPYSVLSKPFVAEPGSFCNMTYLMIGPFESRNEAENVVSYIATKFFRFFVCLLKNTQNAYKKVYEFVPMQDFTRPWSDAELYAKYGLTDDEIAFIESMIRPMEL